MRRLLPRAWMGVWDVYLAVWVPLKRAWAWVWHGRRLREYDAMMDRWLPVDGIACPECGNQMVDLGDRIPGSFPSQVQVHCEKCGFTALRFLRG